jgi:hypothetical protein
LYIHETIAVRDSQTLTMMEFLLKATRGKHLLILCFFGLAVVFPWDAIAKQDTLRPKGKLDSLSFARGKEVPPEVLQQDIIDIYLHLFNKEKAKRRDSLQNKDSLVQKSGKLHTSFLPGVGYTLQTQFAVAIAANGAFYTDDADNANLSVVNVIFSYTQLKQFILPIQSNIWTKGNKLNLLGDWRYYKYPQDTYGLGGHTALSDADQMDFSYFTFHQIVAKHLTRDFYLGLGYNLDLHWGIVDYGYPDKRATDYLKYITAIGANSSSSVSTGPSLNLLFDNRRNSIYPLRGIYTNIVYRPNFTFMGSDQNWQSLLMDFRKYFKLPGYKSSVFALWSYAWLTLNGNPPYLDLPSTGWDTYSNIGRGYIQSRFRGNNLIYAEAEFRFVFTENGLLGGVFFANAQTVSEWPSNRFETILPGVGTGLRIKINKHSNTNFAIDYGWGVGGSNGIFVNLGEVF